MPLKYIPFKSLDKVTLEPMYNQIVNDIAQAIDVPEESLKVVYRGNELAKTDSNHNATLRSRDNKPTTITKQRIEVSISDDYDEESITSTATYHNEFEPIFHDPISKSTISPIYFQFNIEIEFSYSTSSKSEARELRDRIRLNISRMRNIWHHELDLTMIIPDSIETFIGHLYDKVSRLRPVELVDYFKNRSSNRIHLLTDMSNKENTKLAIRERQTRIVGVFDLVNPDETDRNNDQNNFTQSLNYNLSITLPVGLTVRYPIMVCNQLLDYNYLIDEEERITRLKEERHRINERYIGNSMNHLGQLETHRELQHLKDKYEMVRIPFIDQYPLEKGTSNHSPIMSVLVEVDESDRQTLFNLKDLGDYYISNYVLDYIKENRDQVVYPFNTFVYLGLYQEDRYFDAPMLEILPDLTVRSTVPLDLCRNVRVTLSLYLDLPNLPKEVKDYLNKNPILNLAILKEATSLTRSIENSSNNKSLLDNLSIYSSNFLNYLTNRDEVEVADLDINLKSLEGLGIDRNNIVTREGKSYLSTQHLVKPTLGIVCSDRVMKDNVISKVLKDLPEVNRAIHKLDINLSDLQINQKTGVDLLELSFAMKSMMIFHVSAHRSE